MCYHNSTCCKQVIADSPKLFFIPIQRNLTCNKCNTCSSITPKHCITPYVCNNGVKVCCWTALPGQLTIFPSNDRANLEFLQPSLWYMCRISDCTSLHKNSLFFNPFVKLRCCSSNSTISFCMFRMIASCLFSVSIPICLYFEISSCADAIEANNARALSCSSSICLRSAWLNCSTCDVG